MNDDYQNSKIERTFSKKKWGMIYFSLFLIATLFSLAYLRHLSLQISNKFSDLEDKINQRYTNEISTNKILQDDFNAAMKEIDKKIAQNNFKDCSEISTTKNNSAQSIKIYYKMRLKADQGKDFSADIDLLLSSDFVDDEIRKKLEELLPFAIKNYDEPHLANQFNQLIKKLYMFNCQIKNNSLSKLHCILTKLIFIRPIAYRAITNGGIDKEIIMIESFLSAKDLHNAKLILDTLDYNVDDFISFKQNLNNKIIQNDLFTELDNLFFLNENKLLKGN